MKENLLLITAKKTHGKQGSCSKRSVYYANEEVQFISKPRQQRSSLFMDADQDLIDMESSECEQETSREDVDAADESIHVDNNSISLTMKDSGPDRNKKLVARSMEKPTMLQCKLDEKTIES